MTAAGVGQKRVRSVCRGSVASSAMAGAILLTLCWTVSATAEGMRFKNMLRNPSFEDVGEDGVPIGWFWSDGRAKAKLVIDDSAGRSGRRSAKLVNPTPKAPHVYASLTQEVLVRPGTPHVLSCYVKSPATGIVWIGGGARWQHRAAFPARAGNWTRVVGTFTTEPDERRFTVRINTDDRTHGVWIDDVMLEEGTDASAFVTDRSLEAGTTVLNIGPMELGENLLPNSSFESRRDGQAQHWAFDRRTTDAAMTIDDGAARFGRRSLRFTNGTAFGPHIYGQLMLAGGVEVKPGTEYTLSAYVRSEDPGLAWIGGAGGWRIRCRLPRTGEAWQRISQTFTTRTDETNIPIMINTDSPTTGFWVDGIKLEEGGYATPYVPPENPDRPQLDVAARPPRPVGAANLPGRVPVVPLWAPSKYPPATSAFIHREFWADGALRMPRRVRDATITITVTPADAGRALCSASRRMDIAAGPTAIEFGWEAYSVTGRRLTLSCTVADSRDRTIVSRNLELNVYTGGLVERELKRAESLLADLKTYVRRLRPRGFDSQALVTATVIENFVPFAREDVAHGEVGRAYDAAMTMQQIARRRIAECKDVLAGRRDGLPAARYRTSTIEIDGSSFVAETINSRTGQASRGPVFFSGYGAFGAVRRDIEKLPAYGANIIQVEFGPNSVLLDEDTLSDSAINQFLATCDRAAEAGVSVNLLLSPHYFPQWAYNKWPHLAEFEGGFLKYDINAPEARAVVERSLRYVIPRVKGHPALHSLCLSNEPVSVDLSRSVTSRAMWRRWLRKRYGDLDALNRAWGTQHATFDGVPVETEFKSHSPATYDFVRFNQEQFAAWHTWMAGIVREIAPDVPLHAKIMMSAHWGRHHHGIWSVSPDLFASFSRIHGNDCCKWYTHPWHANAGGWACDWVGENMGYDYQRSISDMPIFNSENHLILDRDLEPVPPEFIYNVIWQGAIHGMGASVTWLWERTFDSSSDAAGSIMHRPACTEAQGIASLDLARLAPEVTALQRLEPQVAILSSLAANVHSDEHTRVMGAAYTALNFCGVAIGFVTERQLESWVADAPGGQAANGTMPRGLRNAKLLVVPAAAEVTAATLRGVREFAARGGRVVRIGACFTHNEYRAQRPERLTLGDTWPAADAAALWPRFRVALKNAKIVPTARLLHADGTPVWGVEVRAFVKEDGRIVVNLANYLRQPQRARLMVCRDGAPGSWRRAGAGVDLVSGLEVDAEFTVPSLQPMLIELRP